ncbi:GNAT family N-acetyltransferase [Mangrovibacterium marinum]|uniref:GNAT family N-acetyltransferase n=1 Tax=Mangrovibacterium marinum TaxID=1639118 RepID=UPI002A18D257|nr:GNAT family N-acetyltransferase [Mangrovibacterium marinum]
MLIRKAQPQDAGTIARFQQAMAWETENLQLDNTVLHQGVQAVFDDPSKGIYYVAEQEGNIVASLLTTFEWSDWRNGTVLWIQSVYVSREFRQQGVYSAMYSHIRRIVEQNDQLKGIRLYADKSNQTAQLVYQKAGMTADHYLLYEWLK